MSKQNATAARRERVERNIYRRADGKLEIGYRDSTGRQRWQVIAGGITAARAERDSILGAKGKGENVVPSPRLRFSEVADRWLAEQVADLRPATRAAYENDVRVHLRPRWGRRRLDTITVNDAAKLVRELRAEGKAEWTISGVLKAANRCFRFAHRRMGWHGMNPIPQLENGERPKTSGTRRRRIFTADELAQTIEGAHEPWRTLFSLAAVTGARLSELLGLTWDDVDLSDREEAMVSIAWQVDRQGKRQPPKTEESRRAIELPRSLVAMMLAHQACSPHTRGGDFVFCARSGRALSQRNVLRALRLAETKARTPKDRPTFPILHETDRDGERVKVPRGAVPNFHALRHTAASEAIAAGESAEEVSWLLGHKNSVVTRSVYVQEIKSVERSARRRSKMEDRYGSMLGSAMEASEREAKRKGEVVKLTARAKD